MNFSTAKLEAFVSTNGRYFKNHSNKFKVDTSADDVDYLIPYCHYILAIPKGLVDIDDTLDEARNTEHWLIEQISQCSETLEYVSMKPLYETSRTKVCVFTNSAGKEIWINSSFFTDFINGMFNRNTGKFADDITFIGSDDESPVVAWHNDDLIGLFLPIINVPIGA